MEIIAWSLPLSTSRERFLGEVKSNCPILGGCVDLLSRTAGVRFTCYRASWPFVASLGQLRSTVTGTFY